MNTISATPVLWLPPEKCANSAEVAFMAQEVALFLTLGPESDGIRQCIHRLVMAPNKRASKVYVLDLVLLRL
jgi:hypothetical protein